MLLYLMTFIILETFIFINLIIAVIVNNLERAQLSVSSHDKARQNKSDADSGGQKRRASDSVSERREYFGMLGPDGTKKQLER